MTALAELIRRDIKIALRVGGGALIGVLFFLTVTVLMPFAIGPDLALLTRLGPAILWLGALLASLLTLDRLFTADHEDGSLDLIVMGRTPLELACAAKALAHWLAAGLPLIVATPVLGLLLNLDAEATSAVALTLLVGTPALTFTGMIGAALPMECRPGDLRAAWRTTDHSAVVHTSFDVRTPRVCSRTVFAARLEQRLLLYRLGKGYQPR